MIRPFVLALLLLSSSAANAAGLSSIFDDPVTTAVIVLNIGLLIFFLVRFDRFAVAHGGEILTTVGIFGCFLGIAIALLKFDTGNVLSSVPQLLSGVKTAFWASVSGVFGALVIRLVHRVRKTPVQQTAGAPKATTIDDLVQVMQSLQKSIAGSDDGTLLSQLKLMRQEQRDQLSTLQKSFDAFATKMAEDGSKALIEALREVIHDFNAQINAQFGENFQQLNQAVAALVVWQEQYKAELNTLQGVQKQTAQDLQVAAENLTQLVRQSSAFVDSANSLGALITSLTQQYALIQESEQTLATVLREMKDVTPQFATKLDQLTEAMKNGVAQVHATTSEVVQNFGLQQQTSVAEMKKLLVETIRQSQTETNEQLRASLELLRNGVTTLDQGLQVELTNSLETLGTQLASLSEKFVSDYTPLTDKLREVVRIAQQGN